MVGSDMTEFALGVWVYQQTGSVTQFALISLFIYLPKILISPLAGALVDRWDRRWCMILSDSVAWLSTLFVMILRFSGGLEVWHIYLAVAVNSIFNAFQAPAYSAAVSQLVSPQQLGRANGMVQTTRAMARLVAPMMAGFLVSIIHIEGILIIDCLTFFAALGTLLSVRFPRLPGIHATEQRQSNIRQLLEDISFGWNYIARRQGLLGLLILLGIFYLTEGVLQVVFWPLVLNFASTAELGIVLSISGCGMLLGSVMMSVWGGPKPRIYGILFLMPLQGTLLCLGGLRPSIFLAGMAAFGYLFLYPIIVSCNQTIWQSKVPYQLQGRIFALQIAIQQSLAILAYLCTGPLVDYVFEPLMAPNGLLAGSFGHLIGVGTGRGIGLMLTLMGVMNILATVLSYQAPRLRRVEKELPDAISNLNPTH
jgi:DHA3 family macrolide efflux protein-like MFS transporter